MLIVFANCVEAQVTVEYGKKEKVFDWSSQKCKDFDMPDAPARAYVDSDGKIHMVTAENALFQSVGDNLNDLKRDCQMAFDSKHDATPRMYQDYEWILSPYTLDGTTVYGLTHNEYHGWEKGRMGCNSDNTANCWWNSINMAISKNKGATYEHIVPAPGHMVISSPNDYNGNNTTGPVGWFEPSNIIEKDNYYYFLVGGHNSPDPWTSTIARSSNLADPKSWRLWDGSEFNKTGDRARATPIGGAFNFFLTYNEYLGEYLSAMCHWDPNPGTQRGLYYSTTKNKNLTDWTSGENVGGDPYMYCSLIQPGDETRNFEKIGRSPWVYYTACGSGINKPTCGSNDRDVWRVRVRFDKAGEENKYELLDLKMSEWGGNKTLDSSFFVNDANLSGNNIGFEKGEGLSYVKFGGANNWLDVPNSSSLNVTGDITIETKVKIKSMPSGYYPVIIQKAEGAKRQYGLYLAGSNGKLHFSLSKGQELVGSVSNSGIADGKWHDIKLIYKNNESKAYYVIDGKLDAVGDHNGAKIGEVTSGANVEVGSGIDGNMDYVKVKNYAMDTSVYPTNTPTPPLRVCTRCSNWYDFQQLNWQENGCSTNPPTGVNVTTTYDESCTPPASARKTLQCYRCSKTKDKEFVWWDRLENQTCLQDPAEGTTVVRAVKNDCALAVPSPVCGGVMEECCTSEPKCEEGLECSGANRCLKVAPPPVTDTPKVPGDANGDEAVNLTDLGIWKEEQVGGVGLRADFNGDGKVDLEDLGIWKTEYVKQ